MIDTPKGTDSQVNESKTTETRKAEVPKRKPAAKRFGVREPNQAARILALAEQMGMVCFHTPGGDPAPYALIPVEGHREVWRMRSNNFRQLLAVMFYRDARSPPGRQATEEALGVLQARALFDGAEQRVFTRLAEHEGAIYLDLADEKWRAVRIDKTGWRVVENPPVMFRRSRGMLPLPMPVRGGSLETLRGFLNVGSDDDWLLMQAWLLAAYRPDSPYPLLALHGEQGSAKSWTAGCLRNLIDSNIAPLRAEPRNLHDLVLAATNGWVIALDNLSSLHLWLSDGLCRLSTGGGFSTRELYTNEEEALFDVRRPVILTGITELAVQADLQDRSILVVLPTIDDERRRDERSLRAAFEVARPAILGAILSGVSGALKHLDSVKLDRKPRMADFAIWATAAEPGLGWGRGAFMRAYTGNRQDATETTLEAWPIVAPLRELLEISAGSWEGTATWLLTNLETLVPDAVKARRGWPAAANALSGQLRRLAPALRSVGIQVDLVREDHARTRTIRIVRIVPTVRAVPERVGSADDPTPLADDPADDLCGDRPQNSCLSDDPDGADDLSAMNPSATESPDTLFTVEPEESAPSPWR